MSDFPIADVRRASSKSPLSARNGQHHAMIRGHSPTHAMLSLNWVHSDPALGYQNRSSTGIGTNMAWWFHFIRFLRMALSSASIASFQPLRQAIASPLEE